MLLNQDSASTASFKFGNAVICAEVSLNQVTTLTWLQLGGGHKRRLPILNFAKVYFFYKGPSFLIS